MGKFVKKPVVVDAVQWDGSREGAMNCGLFPGTIGWGIHTLEGFMLARPWDWIITGVEGEKYPCRPDIFEKTYQAVDILDQ